MVDLRRPHPRLNRTLSHKYSHLILVPRFPSLYITSVEELPDTVAIHWTEGNEEVRRSWTHKTK